MGTERQEANWSFPPTQWSLVGRAGADDSSVRRQALEALLVRYLPALRAYLVLKKRLDPERADDLVQGFITSKVLEQGLFARADPHRGKFRVLLITALNNFVIDDYRRRGAPPTFSLSDTDAPQATEGGESPPDVFDVAWARELLAEVLRRMRHECTEGGREDLWGVFECRVLEPTLEGAPVLPYEQLVERFGFRSPSQAANALVTAKRLFARTLRAVVSEYAGDEAAVEEEIRDLQQILARSGK
jgi:RNA polymerase sigma-70 factor (ECF subfamily)